MTAIEGRTTIPKGDLGEAPTATERIARLEERSRHAATVAQLYRVALTIIIGIVGTLGGLIIHLHNQQIALIEKLLAN